MSAKISIYRGTTYQFTYRHTDDTGQPVSLGGCTIYFTVKGDMFDSDLLDTTAVIQKTITSHTDAGAGLSAWTLNDMDTQVDPGKYYFDVIIENAQKQAEPPSLIGTMTVIGKQTNRNVANG